MHPAIFETGVSEGQEVERYHNEFGFHTTLFELADGDYLKKKELQKENIHQLLYHLRIKISNSKAVNSAYKNKETLEL